MDLHTIEICAGVGMLGEGLRAGLAHMGCTHRTIAYIEREAYAASVLVARMEEGSLDAAPIWPDLLTFDGRRFRGAVDCIAAGFPCQDLSLAGRRAGLDGARSGLFFNILDIADACGAANLFLENVAGIASATASVVDEAEGALEERAAARVLGELADRGWNAEWLTLSASDVGASHGRARWFCWAWRMGDTGLQHQHLQQREDGAEHSGTGKPVAHAERTERGPERVGGIGSIQGNDGGWPEAHGGTGIANAVLGHADQQRQQQSHHANGTKSRNQSRAGVGGASCELANTEGDGRNQGRPESSGEQGRSDASVSSESMECEFCGYVYPAGLGLYGCPDCLGEGFDDVADPGCSDAPGRQHIAGACGFSPEYQPVCSPVADTSSPGQQGVELGRACDGNGGGAGSTWIN